MDSSEYLEVNKRRSRRVLSLKERIEVIKIAETRRDTRELAKRFECGRTQILSILSQKDRLLKEWLNNGDPNRLRRRPSAFSYAINKIIAEWIVRCRCAQLPLSDQVIMEKANQAKKFFRYGEFRPNRRWLDRFKNRYKLDTLQLEVPNPSLNDGIERSLKISDIYEDIKDYFDENVITAMNERKNSVDYRLFVLAENNQNGSFDSSFKMSENSNNEVYEINDDMSWSPGNFCEAQIIEDDITEDEEPKIPKVNEVQTVEILDDEPIQIYEENGEQNGSLKNDKEALECIKKLEEYSMLKENYRAIGLIMQLEKLYKGKLDS